MPSDYTLSNTDAANAATFNKLFGDINVRLKSLEKAESAINQASDELVQLGLAKINPAVEEALAVLDNVSQLSNLFEARSTSEVEIATGVTEFIIEPEDRPHFVGSRFLLFFIDGQTDKWMSGQTQSWNKETGQLLVDITTTNGQGIFSDWGVVAASILPDLGVSPDVYTKAETDTAIAQAKSDLLGGAPDAALDTLTELADALADDANFAATITSQLASKSNAGHSHTIADVTGLQNALDAKQDAGAGGGGGFEVGDMKMIAHSAVEDDWMLCDGRELSRTTYSDLFAKIGTAWGAGDGTATFNIPPMSGRAPIGAGQGGGLTNRNLGDTGGAEFHTLTQGEMPSHNHSYTRPNYTGSTTGTGKNGVNYSNGSSSVSTGSKGSNQPHNNMQPFAAINFIIKAA